MNARRCPRLWEAEAAADDRLDPTARASFDRHASTCASCACERATFEHLRALSRQLPSPTTTPLDRKRLRAAILKNANSGLTTAASARPAWLLSTAIVLASLVIWATWKFSTIHRDARDSVPVAGDVVFEVVPVGIARWKVDRAGSDVQVALSDGSIAVHVVRLSMGQSFLLALPDGQIEVRGTRFVAHVDRGRTRDVTVSEGTVALRLVSFPERLLGKGDSWSAEPDELAVDTAPSSAMVLPDSTARAHHGDKAFPRQPPQAQAPRGASAGAVFSDGMTAFSSGAYESADATFARFQTAFPEDARNEDAAFLRIIIARRLGDDAVASQRARAYLQRYPNGFRRRDVERMNLSTSGAR